MMNRKTLEDLRTLLREVDEATMDVIIDLDLKLELDDRGFRREHPTPASPNDRLYSGNKNTGALRRKSMDLTRKLSELRRSE